MWGEGHSTGTSQTEGLRSQVMQQLPRRHTTILLYHIANDHNCIATLLQCIALSLQRGFSSIPEVLTPHDEAENRGGSLIADEATYYLPPLSSVENMSSDLD